MAGRITKGPPAMRPKPSPEVREPSSASISAQKSQLSGAKQTPDAPRQKDRSQNFLKLQEPQRRRTLDPGTIHTHAEPPLAQERARKNLDQAIEKLRKTSKKGSQNPLELKLSRKAERRLTKVFNLTLKHLDAQGVKYQAAPDRYRLTIEPDTTTALGRFAKGLKEKHNVDLEYRPGRLWAKGARGVFITGNPDKLLLSHAGVLAAKPTSTEIHETRHSYHKQLFHVRNQHNIFAGNAFPPDDGWQDEKKSYAKRFSLEELSTFGLQHVHAAGGLGVVRAGLAGNIKVSPEELESRMQTIISGLDERAQKSSGPALAKRLMDTCTKLEGALNAHRMSFYKDPTGTLQLMARNEEHRAEGQFTFTESQTKKSGFSYIACTYRDLASGRRLEIPLLHDGAKTLFFDSLVKLSDSKEPEKLLGLLMDQYIRPHNESLMTIAAEQSRLYAAIDTHKAQLRETLDAASKPWTEQDKEKIALAVENLRFSLRRLRETITASNDF